MDLINKVDVAMRMDATLAVFYAGQLFYYLPWFVIVNDMVSQCIVRVVNNSPPGLPQVTAADIY